MFWVLFHVISPFFSHVHLIPLMFGSFFTCFWVILFNSPYVWVPFSPIFPFLTMFDLITLVFYSCFITFYLITIVFYLFPSYLPVVTPLFAIIMNYRGKCVIPMIFLVTLLRHFVIITSYRGTCVTPMIFLLMSCSSTSRTALFR